MRIAPNLALACASAAALALAVPAHRPRAASGSSPAASSLEARRPARSDSARHVRSISHAAAVRPALGSRLRPDVARGLRLISAMTIVSVPSTATWDRFEIAYHQPGRTDTCSGWLLEDTGTGYHVLDWYGRERRLRKQATRATPSTLARAVEELRMDRPPGIRRASDMDRLILGFSPPGLQVARALVAAWAMERGDMAGAASLISMCLDSLEDMGRFTASIRNQLASAYEGDLLAVFSFDPDYDRTIALARHLSKPIFDGSGPQGTARELGFELEQRRTDLRRLTMPDSANWDSLQRTMSRPRALDYLIARLRFLRGYQLKFMGLFGEMRHDRESEVELQDDARAVINPLHELQHLDLGVADIPVLAPLLADSSQLAVVNSVLPDGMILEERDPYRVADLAEGLINHLARRPLTHASEILAKDAAGRAAYLQHLTDWSRSHADMSPADLDLDVIETTTSGMEMSVASRKLVTAKDRRAIPVLLRRLDDFQAFRSDLLQGLYELDAAEAVDSARAVLAAPVDVAMQYADPQSMFELRENYFWAALILVRHGDRARHEGLPTLQDLLFVHGKGAYWDIVSQAVRDLGIGDARRVQCGDWEPVSYDLFVPSAGPMARRAFLAGCESTYRFLLQSLSSSREAGHTYGTDPRSHKWRRVTVSLGDLTASVIAEWRTSEFRFDVMERARERRRKRAELSKWLSEQYRRIQSGERPDMW